MTIKESIEKYFPTPKLSFGERIDGALSAFTKTRDELVEINEEINENISNNMSVIKQMEHENNKISSLRENNTSIISNINSILKK